VVTGVQIRLTPADSEALAEKVKRISQSRRASQPLEGRNAGCFFKNPTMGPSAGALIDGVGLKGYRIGGAQISTVHANFIVNTGNASASDIIELARLARDTVGDKHGIWLEPEVVILGGADVREKKTTETES